MTDIGLTVDGVSVRFAGLAALDSVSVAFDGPGLYGLIGPNGAGKSTLISVITGYVRPVGGSVRMGPSEITANRPSAIARAGIVRSFQSPRLLDDETVLVNILVGMSRVSQSRAISQMLGTPGYRRVEREHRFAAAEMGRSFGFEPKDLDRPVRQLPFGYRRLVEVARVLASRPPIVLLDEPAAGLAKSERILLGDRLVQFLANNPTILILTEHDVDLVRRLCHRVTVLSSGRVIAEGVPESVLKDPAVVEAYFGSSDAEG